MKIYLIQDAPEVVTLSIGAEYSRVFNKEDEPFSITQEEWDTCLEPTGFFTTEKPVGEAGRSSSRKDKSVTAEEE